MSTLNTLNNFNSINDFNSINNLNSLNDLNSLEDDNYGDKEDFPPQNLFFAFNEERKTRLLFLNKMVDFLKKAETELNMSVISPEFLFEEILTLFDTNNKETIKNSKKCKIENVELSKNVNFLNEKARTLFEDLNVAKNEMKILEEQAAECLEENDSQNALISQLKAELEACKNEERTKASASFVSLIEAEQAKEELKMKIEKMEANLKSCVDEKNWQQKMLGEFKMKIEKLEANLNSCTDEKNWQAAEEFGKLEANLKSCVDEKNWQEKILEGLKRAADKCEYDKKGAEDAVKILEGDIGEMDQRIKTLERENSGLKNESTFLKNELVRINEVNIVENKNCMRKINNLQEQNKLLNEKLAYERKENSSIGIVYNDLNRMKALKRKKGMYKVEPKNPRSELVTENEENFDAKKLRTDDGKKNSPNNHTNSLNSPNSPNSPNSEEGKNESNASNSNISNVVVENDSDMEIMQNDSSDDSEL